MSVSISMSVAISAMAVSAMAVSAVAVAPMTVSTVAISAVAVAPMAVSAVSVSAVAITTVSEPNAEAEAISPEPEPSPPSEPAVRVGLWRSFSLGLGCCSWVSLGLGHSSGVGVGQWVGQRWGQESHGQQQREGNTVLHLRVEIMFGKGSVTLLRERLVLCT